MRRAWIVVILVAILFEIYRRHRASMLIVGLVGSYGIDSPWIVASYAVLGAGLMLVIILAKPLLLGKAKLPSLGIHVGLVIVLACFFFFSVFSFAVSLFLLHGSLFGKFEMAQTVVDAVGEWQGTEQVLDVGCGRGLLGCVVAKHLEKLSTQHCQSDKTKQNDCTRNQLGWRVHGVDVWSTDDLSSNSLATTLANIAAEGLHDKVIISTADARALPYEDESFDVVVSSLALHNIFEGSTSNQAKQQREIAIRETERVTKQGGRVVIWDICGHHSPNDCAVMELAKNMKKYFARVYVVGPFDVFYPSYIVVARKNSSLFSPSFLRPA
eukprot:c358_g1_i1.p1 GENE.c358_g1_i1~~c358_g1_i1.p1  ORF type:complete len:341 (-),score=74.69 c358_g1_i1:41-1018(-)